MKSDQNWRCYRIFSNGTIFLEEEFLRNVKRLRELFRVHLDLSLTLWAEFHPLCDWQCGRNVKRMWAQMKTLIVASFFRLLWKLDSKWKSNFEIYLIYLYQPKDYLNWSGLQIKICQKQSKWIKDRVYDKICGPKMIGE